MLNICAIIVTYFPKPEVLENIVAIRGQVQRLIVVDNSSSHELLADFRRAALTLQFSLIENGSNMGIAIALNRAIEEAAGSEWVVLFDQDSRVRDNFVANMLSYAISFPAEARCSLLVPQYFDMRFKHLLPPILAADGTIAVAMTSGSFMRRALFEEVGYFEDLFIYEVDYEFSLRIRKLGHTIRECSTAVLDHNPGDPQAFCLWGKRLFYTTNYSPVSRYYMHRNAEWLRRRYEKDFPEYFRFSKWVLRKDYLKILLGENQKFQKLFYIIKGKWDGRRGNMKPLTLQPTLELSPHEK